jgi:hypothetical protein
MPWFLEVAPDSLERNGFQGNSSCHYFDQYLFSIQALLWRQSFPGM